MRRTAIAAAWIFGATVPLLVSVVMVFGCCVLPFQEVAAEYAHPLTDKTIGYIYAAPFGDPALGPVAYPHRSSASEIPQAALSHHVQDSTHIAGSVLTIGAQSGMFGYAVSGFHGREPDESVGTSTPKKSIHGQPA